jgi:hypothetical protein
MFTNLRIETQEFIIHWTVKMDRYFEELYGTGTVHRCDNDCHDSIIISEIATGRSVETRATQF